MTIFTIIRSECGMRVNYSQALCLAGKRRRYVWVCAKNGCKNKCVEATCPMMRKIAALNTAESAQ